MDNPINFPLVAELPPDFGYTDIEEYAKWAGSNKVSVKEWFTINLSWWSTLGSIIILPFGYLDPNVGLFFKGEWAELDKVIATQGEEYGNTLANFFWNIPYSLVEVAALNFYDLVVVIWGFFEWFWAELFWKTTVIVADWSWDSHRNVQLWIKHLMSWDRWMVSHYD